MGEGGGRRGDACRRGRRGEEVEGGKGGGRDGGEEIYELEC